MCSRSAQAPGFRNSSQLTEKLPGGRFPSTAFERKPPMMFLSTGHFRVRVLHTRTWSCTAVMPPSTPGNDCPHKALSRKGWRSEPPVALSGCVSSASFNLEKFLVFPQLLWPWHFRRQLEECPSGWVCLVFAHDCVSCASLAGVPWSEVVVVLSPSQEELYAVKYPTTGPIWLDHLGEEVSIVELLFPHCD